MDRQSKEAAVSFLSDKFGKAKLAILADYRGLDVNTLVEFRRKLATGNQGEFKVIKNSLAMRAIEGTDFAGLAEFLTGPNAVLFGYEDVVTSAKALTDFAKENDALEVKAASLDGRVLTEEQIKALAGLPSKEVLQAILLGVLQAPSRNLVSLLANCNRQILNVLVAYKDKLEEGGD